MPKVIKKKNLTKIVREKKCINCWETVYKMHKNEITTKWKKGKIKVYMKNLQSIREYEEDIIYFKGPRKYNGSMDMAMEIIEINHFA